MVEQSLHDIDLRAITQDRQYHPSPAAWEDQVLYFLMLDRFSNGQEKDFRDNDNQWVNDGVIPPFQPEDAGNALHSEADRAAWFEAGGRFAGGTLQGLESKLGYLQRLGITAVWISPIFKQTNFEQTYHGYGIQNYLDVDPRFGTREDLKRLVQTAHALGIYVILDIILNHAGDVFAYAPDRYDAWDQEGRHYFDPRWDGCPYTVRGFRDAEGVASLPFPAPDPVTQPEGWPHGAVWPQEFQQPGIFTAKGTIQNWDYDPEYLEGDFCSLKDIHLGFGGADDYRPAAGLRHLCDVYKYWIAYADVDGFRVDTVKHMEGGATRFFTSVIHEFAQSVGKENFSLIGEITGGRQRAFEMLEITGLTSALGINDIPDKLEYLVKGWRDPEAYFSLFRNSLLVQKDSHVWFRNRVVTTFDDHDQVRKGSNKARFCHDTSGEKENSRLVLNVLALMATTLGIPCVYYGTEQQFDGHGDNDRYLREAMFGGAFGAFGSKDRHFFNEENPVYREFAKILALRREHIALRRGRQYLRPVSGNGTDFGLPCLWGGRLKSIVAWSRLFNDREMLCAINTDPNGALSAWVTIDASLHQPEEKLTCLYSSDAQQTGQTVEVEARNGRAVHLTVPAAGFVVYG